MTPDRPDFAAIQERLEFEQYESILRTQLRGQIETVLNNFTDPNKTVGTAKGSYPIAVGSEVYPYLQVVADGKGRSIVTFTWMNQYDVVNSSIIYSVENMRVLNRDGELLKGAELDEARSVLGFMLDQRNQTTSASLRLRLHASHQ